MDELSDSSSTDTPLRVVRWAHDRTCYYCADGANVVMRKMDRPYSNKNIPAPRSGRCPYGAIEKKIPAYCIAYGKEGIFGSVMVAANAVFDRTMRTIFCAADSARTLTISKTQHFRWNAFACTALRSVLIPDGLKRLESKRCCLDERWVSRIGAFTDGEIEKVRLPKTLRMLGAHTFAHCRRLQEITLPDGLKKIRALCFCETRLREIEIPRSVTRIGDDAFAFCRALCKVTFQEGSKLQSIGNMAFKSTCIEEFVAPSQLRVIGQGAFGDCQFLKHVELNEGLEVLGTKDE